MNVRQAMERMHARRAVTDGLPAAYRRGNARAVVTVVRARSLLRLGEPSGNARTELWDNDFTLRKATLVLDGEPTVPAVGDLLDVTEEGRVNRYEVQSPTPSEKCYTEIDSKAAFRIHAKFLKRVPPT